MRRLATGGRNGTLRHFSMVSRRCSGVVPQQQPSACTPMPADFFHQVGKLSRRDIEYRLAVFAARQTGIRVDDDRQRADLGQTFDDGMHLLRTKTAVNAERVYAQITSSMATVESTNCRLSAACLFHRKSAL